MMRALRFNLRQMLLVMLIALGTAIAIGAGVRAIGYQVPMPWIYPLLTLVAADAVVTQRMVRRQRLSLTEQFGIRAVELALLIVAVRITSLAAEESGSLAAIQPWLRDPLTFFDGRFTEYFIAALVVWVLTTTLAHAAMQMEADPPRAGVRGLPSEESAALQDRALALASFDRLWIGCLMFTMIGSGLAMLNTTLTAVLRPTASVSPLLAVVMVLVGGFGLHSQGQFEQLHYAWQVEQATIYPEVTRRWRRASWLLIGAAAVAGLLLANLVHFAPPPPLVPLANALLAVMALMLAVLVAIFSLLLLPFAWLLSLLTGGSAPAMPAVPRIPPLQIVDTSGERPLLPALIFWSCIVLLLTLAGLRYLREREDLRALLSRWPTLRRIMAWFGATWIDMRDWGVLVAATVRHRLSRSRPRSTRPAAPRDARGQLRTVYAKMVRAAGKRGVGHPRSQTQLEFRDALRNALPPSEPDASGLTSVYLKAEYGPQPAGPADVRSARAHWRRLERLFAVADRKKRRGMRSDE